ncbi:MAG TPA: two-component regulator propeller domain-containing protein [Kofleriaceae bacterium]|nr:two-component regulator propeller domain-containing protein [Kofleriaceae bacterium]
MLALSVVAALLSTGCPNGERDTTPKPGVRVRVRSFTEPAPIRLITSAQGIVFTASDHGVDRWELRTGRGLHLNRDNGLPGDKVVAMTEDEGSVWIATDGGVTRYDVEATTFSALPKPPQVLGLDQLEGVSLAPAGDGGLWVGHPKGLFYTNRAGQWVATPVTAHVTSMYRQRDGRLWVGTMRGLIMRQPDGQTFEYSDEQGCNLEEVRFIAGAPDGGPLIVGETTAGKQRIVLMREDGCATYRSSPDIRWTSASRRGRDTAVLANGKLYSLRPDDGGARRLSRDGMRLYPTKVGAEGRSYPSPFVIRALDNPVPTGATVMAAAGEEILIGTRDRGTARLSGGRARNNWLRRGELVEGARTLSVACARREECYIATGSTLAWRFDGATFTQIGDGESRVLAFVRSPAGKVYGIRESEDRSHALLTLIRGDVWVRVSELAIDTPGGGPRVTFARFSPSGVLWLGLAYKDEASEERAYGVALIDIALGAIAYHHASTDSSEARRGVLPIPNNVVEASFMSDDEAWLATTEGAVRVRGEKVQVFTEGDGLKTEILRGVACSAGGMVYVAARTGVGAYDGDTWRYPRVLAGTTNDIEISPDGRLWMATSQGLAVFDGARVRRLDVRRGLLQNDIDDVALDHLGRVWVRGSQGITVVTP